MLYVETSRTTHRPTTPDLTPAPTGGGGLHVVRGHDEEFPGTRLRRKLGAVSVALIESDQYELIRPNRQIDQSTEGCLRILRPLRGEVWVFQDGRHSVSRAPDLIICDSNRPYKIVLPEPFRMVEILVSHRLMGLTTKDAELLTATALPGRLGLAALLSELLAGLDRHGDEINSAIDLLGCSVGRLSAALFADRMRELAADPEVARNALMLRIQAHVREQLADPELTPYSVAQRYNISLRYLQKLFSEHGTSPARWIRDERLDRCHAELSDPNLDHVSVAVIGERSGLFSASHFSRLFRERYGVTPREFRRAAGASTV